MLSLLKCELIFCFFVFVDLWYTAEDANARPPSLVGAIEARWRGTVVGSQETKRRLFSEKTSAVEWVRVGYVVSRSFRENRSDMCC